MTAAVSLVVLLAVLGSSIAVAAGMGVNDVILNQIYFAVALAALMSSKLTMDGANEEVASVEHVVKQERKP